MCAWGLCTSQHTCRLWQLLFVGRTIRSSRHSCCKATVQCITAHHKQTCLPKALSSEQSPTLECNTLVCPEFLYRAWRSPVCLDMTGCLSKVSLRLGFAMSAILWAQSHDILVRGQSVAQVVQSWRRWCREWRHQPQEALCAQGGHGQAWRPP